MNEIVSMISLSVCLLLICKKAISHAESAYKIQSFLLESLVSLINRIITSVGKDTLTSSFSICTRFISFSYLISLPKTLRPTLNRGGHPCAFSDLSVKALNISPFIKDIVIRRKCDIGCSFVTCRAFIL